MKLQLPIILLVGLFLNFTAKASTNFLIATLVPDNSDFGKLLQEFGSEVEKVTEGRAKFTFRFGGQMGPDEVVYQRIGGDRPAIQGGIFTAATLSRVFPDIRVLEVPFTFQTREQSSKVLEKLRPYFIEGLSQKKGERHFKSLGIFEVGEIYLVSRPQISNVNDLRRKRVWHMPDDELAKSFMATMGMDARPLDIPGVMGQLTGRRPGIEAAYAPAAAINALQWHNYVKYITEPPFAFHFQGMLINQNSWNMLSEKDRKAIEQLVPKYEAKIAAANFVAATSSFNAMTGKGKEGGGDSGLTIINWPDSDLKEVKKIRDQILKDITGQQLSKEVIEMVNKHL